MLIGITKRGDQVKIKPSSRDGFTLSLMAANGTGWAETAKTITEAKARAEQTLGKITWQKG